MPFISSSSLIAVARTSSTMLNKGGVSGHPCLVPSLKGSACTFSHLVYAGSGLSYSAFITLRHVLSIPTLLRVFYHKWVLDSIKCFFCNYSYDHVVFILHFVYVAYHVYWFTNVAPTRMPGINPTWSWCMLFLKYCCIQFANSLKILASMFIRDIGV